MYCQSSMLREIICYIYSWWYPWTIQNSSLEENITFSPCFPLPSGQVVMFKPPPVRHWLLWPLCLLSTIWNGCDVHTISRDCSVQNITGNHLKMCVLEEFLMLFIQIFLGRLEIPEGIAFPARFEWTQIQTEMRRTKNDRKQSLIVMDFCLKADGLLNWFILRLSIFFLFPL